MIEAFRENGLHILDHDSEIHESRLEAVLSSIFYALNKRIPSTTDIDVERCIALVKHWLLYAYDRCVINPLSLIAPWCTTLLLRPGALPCYCTLVHYLIIAPWCTTLVHYPGALPYYFTLSNARQCYSSRGERWCLMG